MHPAFYWWWKNVRSGERARCEEATSASPGAPRACGPGGGFGGRGFGRFGGGEEAASAGPGGPRACGPGGGFGGRGFGRFGGGEGRGGEGRGGDEPFGGGPFGVRRPLRFLALKLELRDPQIEELAKVLNELKTERAQAEVDHQRTIAAFADALEGESFSEARAAEGGALRVSSAERLREAVVKALGRIHALLDEPQRKKLAYLIRTGTLTL